MSALRVTGASVTVGLTLVGLIALLMREETGIMHLVLCGSVGGAATGLIWRGRKGLFVGLLIGAAVGLVSIYLYVPFWLIFTLPPHPEVDL